MAFPELTTKRLKLTELNYGYTRQLYDILSRRNVMIYYGFDPVDSYEETARVIESYRTDFLTWSGIRWAVIYRETGDCIGTIGLSDIRFSCKRAEVGFELHPDYWRRGIISEALLQVLRYGFMELGLFRIGAVTYPDNTASNSLLKKIGFQYEGILRGYLYQRGESHDAYSYSILRTDK
ncbi:GNAT family N-acetyltransferase [Alteribacter lacisalsi]|uniref:GNAT family N-acetyltransferase n=1 Tax=Alteribacter lacisalsi TaxID=2045244 RepID=A0A2W0HQ18_9BACI|nr:GNAT family protein [Alteribacter lacisalsi]PYZ98949.1 GNAT family N-acetyltransferase [Alteribacter lacisalsi]